MRGHFRYTDVFPTRTGPEAPSTATPATPPPHAANRRCPAPLACPEPPLSRAPSRLLVSRAVEPTAR